MTRNKSDKDRDELALEFYKWAPAGMFRSPDMAQLALRTLCNVMLDRLINEERAVDLFFVKLHPLPHRSNWKDAIDPRSKPLPRYKRRAMMANGCRDLIDWLIRGRGLAVYPDGTIMRTIEAEPTVQWWKITKEVEKKRLAVLQEAYGKKIAESIRSSLEASKRLWRIWENASALNNGVFLKRGGGRLLAPNRKGDWLRVQTARRLSYHFIRSLSRRSGVPRYKTDSHGEIDRLSLVRPVQRKKTNVRDRRRLELQQEADFRLLVLDAAEGLE